MSDFIKLFFNACLAHSLIFPQWISSYTKALKSQVTQQRVCLASLNLLGARIIHSVSNWKEIFPVSDVFLTSFSFQSCFFKTRSSKRKWWWGVKLLFISSGTCFSISQLHLSTPDSVFCLYCHISFILFSSISFLSHQNVLHCSLLSFLSTPPPTRLISSFINL